MGKAALLLALASCAPPSLYRWGDYDEVLYQHYKHPEEHREFVENLTRSMVHDADPVRLCSIFGADAVLYATIEQWTARYVLLSTITTVEFSYLLKDCKTGAELWSGHHALRNDSSAGQQGLLVAAILAAVEKAKPSYLPMARRANSDALAFPGPGLPAGPYRPEHGHDLEPAAKPAAAH